MLILKLTIKKFTPYSMEKNDIRYERKFFISSLTKHEVESAIKLHPEIFSEIYCQRQVNNIYLDSFDLVNYQDNIIGLDKRTKVRLRWYGDLQGDIQNPVLEFKIKNGLVCQKRSFPLSDFKLDPNFSKDTLQNIFKLSNISERLKMDLACLDFSLLNSYQRQYFLSADKKYRITIDSNLEFYSIASFNNRFLDQSVDHISVIVELKYNKDHDPKAKTIAGYFPFRMTKSSKYVMGIERLNLMKTYSHV